MLIGIKERPPILKWLVLAIQHVFAMFGATILVPLLTGLDIGVALIASGIGTLIYILCTKAKVPIYLGSSFAYIGAIIAAGSFGAAFIGIMAVGLVYIVIAILIHFIGTKWLHKLLPPVVIGPMIIIIGLSLASIAVGNIGLAGALQWKPALIGVITFVTTVIIAIKAKGFLKVIPFIVAILVGYIFAAIFGLVD
jgi:uracil permease